MSKIPTGSDILVKIIPEQIMIIIGNRYFWFIIWITSFSALGRNLFGERIGSWIGLFSGGVFWYFIAPGSGLELLLLVVILIAYPFLPKLFGNNKFCRTVKGLKICPDCAEEVKSSAKVCKYCAYRFEAHNILYNS